MEIESLRLDFLTLIITKAPNNIRAYQRRKEEKKKKKPRRTQAVLCDPAARGPGRRVRPRQRAAQVAHDLGCTAARCLGRAGDQDLRFF